MRDPKERLRDILDSIAAIERYRDRDKQSFQRDELLQTWFLRHLQIIGEAVQLNAKEMANWKSQIVISSGCGSRRAAPCAFTGRGVAMLSSVLRPERPAALIPPHPAGSAHGPNQSERRVRITACR
jgi:hypothetical protein